MQNVSVSTGASSEAPRATEPSPDRCAIVVDSGLPLGQMANAIGVVALTVGQRWPTLVGEPLFDRSGFSHPGLIPVGIAVLGASQDALSRLRSNAIECGCDVIDFPVQGQQTNDYAQFRDSVASLATEELRYSAIAVVGQKKQVRSVTGALPLLRRCVQK
jgi:hypothetical protein